MAIPYTVIKGDYLSLIAKRFGITDWRAIYYDPANAAFRAKRPDPNRIFAGDIVMIPSTAPAAPSSSPMPPVMVLPPPPLSRRLSGRVSGTPVARSGGKAVGGDHIEVSLINRLPIETWVGVSIVAVGPSNRTRDAKTVTLRSLASDRASFFTFDRPPVDWDVSVEIIRTPSTTIGGVPPIFSPTKVSAPGLVDWEIWV